MSEHIGRYQILEQIGRGAMGTIFKAHDPALERVVALKVVSPQLEVTLSIIVQLCEGLYYAHRAGVVHLDVKARRTSSASEPDDQAVCMRKP